MISLFCHSFKDWDVKDKYYKLHYMIITFLVVAILIISAVFHEYAHGWAAYKLGDPTAKDAGRLTLNPIAHLDPVGSVLLPILLVLSKVPFFIAWAKPVPYNPYNLRDQKYGDLKVAIAGPLTNFAIALFFGLVARFLPILATQKYAMLIAFLQSDTNSLFASLGGSMWAGMFILASIICFVNLALMLFNLIPIPPLDGSKVVMNLLPYRLQLAWAKFETYSFIILLMLVFFGFLDFLGPLILKIFSLIIGV